MMMKALEAGGMKAVYSSRRDEELNRIWGEADYLPNDAYYELEAEDYLSGKLEEKYPNCLIKCLYGGLLRFPPGEYRVVFMRRPVEEIRMSLLAFFGDDQAVRQTPNFDKLMEGVIAILRDRKSFLTVDVVNYHDMVSNPEKTLSSLSWPIDVKAASLIPRKENARFTSEGASA